MLNNYNFFFLLILLLGLTTACTFDYREAMIDEELAGGTPNAIIINLNETVIRRGLITYNLTADRAEAFNQRNLTIFTNIQFIEYDRESEIATKGNVGYAYFYSDK